MPNPSSASDSSSEVRHEVAVDLYRQRGAADASKRCDVNSKLGDFDLAQAMIAALELGPGRRVVDVGCGSGQHLLAFAAVAGSRVFGFDFSIQAAGNSHRRGARAGAADAAALPLADGSVDALSCSFAIYYHPRLPDVLDEFARVLAPGGRVAISGPALGTNQELYDFHLRATGADPSDADLMALGYVEGPVAEGLAALGGFTAIETAVHTNHIGFPDGAAFLDYWKATSLFARTPGASVEKGRAMLDPTAEFLLTKRVALVAATRR